MMTTDLFMKLSELFRVQTFSNFSLFLPILCSFLYLSYITGRKVTFKKWYSQPLFTSIIQYSILSIHIGDEHASIQKNIILRCQLKTILQGYITAKDDSNMSIKNNFTRIYYCLEFNTKCRAMILKRIRRAKARHYIGKSWLIHNGLLCYGRKI